MTAAIQAGHEVRIRRERPDVFAFVSDGARLPAWMDGVKRVRRTSPPGPIGVGTTYLVVGKLLGRRVESTYEITAYEPETSFSARLLSPFFSVEDTYAFDEADGVTTVARTVAAHPLGPLRVIGPVLAVSMPRQLKSDHRRLKAVLERTRRRPVAVRPQPAAPLPSAPVEGEGGEPPGSEAGSD